MSASALTTTATLSVVLWLGLLLLRGGFWRANQRLGSGARDAPRDGDWPSVAVVIPARNEADGIGRAVASVLAQDYSGPLRLFVTDDNSDDGTAEVARAAAG